MASFPTLSRPPDFPLKEGRIPNVLSSNTDAGYQIRRAKFTRVRRWWELSYSFLNSADKALLDTFVGTTVVGGALSFTWTHPQTAQEHSVYLEEAPEITNEMYSADYMFSCTMKLTEV